MASAALISLAILWVLAYLSAERVGFAAAVPPRLRGAEEAASAIARLFVALALASTRPMR